MPVSDFVSALRDIVPEDIAPALKHYLHACAINPSENEKVNIRKFLQNLKIATRQVRCSREG